MTRTPISADFFADVTCPWCYVGWTALKLAAARHPQFAVNVSWRSFLLAPDMPEQGVDRKAYLAQRFPPERLQAAHAALNAGALAAGAPLNLDAPERIPRTLDVHRLIHWAASQGVAEPVIDALFHAYWVEGRDIGDHAELRRIGEAAGMDPGEVAKLLASAADMDVVCGFHARAQQIGITGVPVAVMNRRVPVIGAQGADAYAAAFAEASR